MSFGRLAGGIHAGPPPLYARYPVLNSIVMAHKFCENHRTFDRFSSRAKSLSRLGYESRDVNRLLRDTKEEWHRDNIPPGFFPQVYPYHCVAECQACIDAYESRRRARFAGTVQGFSDLYAPRGWLEFQSLTVPPFAPKPAHVHDVLHDTPATERVYQGWLTEYLSERVSAAYASLERCIEHWRDVGRRVCVNPEESLSERVYEDRPIRFPRAALRCLPKELLSQSEVQRVYAIITNQVKSEARDDVALERGFMSAEELLLSVSDDVRDRLEELLSAIALERLRELKKAGEFSERVKAWFSRSDMVFEARLLSDMGIFGFNRESVDSLSAGAASIPLDMSACSEELVNKIQDAWLLACWHEGWMQACIESARVYIPLQTERHVRRRGRPVIRQEYTPNPEPEFRDFEPLPAGCPVYRKPRAVLSEELGLYRRRLRRRGIQFRYVQVQESGVSEEHHHVHSIVGFDVHRMPPPDSPPSLSRSVVQSRNAIRAEMQLTWHQVSGNIIWKRGAWSEAVKSPEKSGNYMRKYMSKERGRTTWVSHNLGIKRYNQERRLIDIGLLPDRPPVVSQSEHGGFRFEPAFTDTELEQAVATGWVGLVRVGAGRLADQVIPKHARVEAVAVSTECPSLGTAAGVSCVHRTRGVTDVIPRCDVWLPVRVFLSLCREGPDASTSAASRLFRELQSASNRVPEDFWEDANRHRPEYHHAHRLQQQFGERAFHNLHSDYLKLRELLGKSPRGP